MKMEIILAFLANLKALFLVVAVFMTFGFILCCVVSLPAADTGEKTFLEYFKEYKLHKLWLIPALLGLLACFPSIDDLWKVRISLIKLELASPENITQATETIERIGKKLECKYLGCEEAKKK